MTIKKILILGSGALKIGEAGEFDYSGSQAIKALKEENIEVVVINPNIATVQTTEGFADKVYFLPVTPEFVERVIQKEKPEGILLSFGGQTALNCGVDLEKMGVLEKYGVKILGTPVKTIELTEDRELFNKTLAEINVSVPKSFAVKSTKDALGAAKKIGYPVMIRAAFALGGKGSGIVTDEKELEKSCNEIFTHTSQILVEECLFGWKEIEYEVVRDSEDNCITVCNMENFDPLGIHTGESIVIAPSQTLSNDEYHMLREVSLKVIRYLGVVGECNIQFALDPKSREYRVIEVNARLSRSSALASKATGYPLAFVAAKLSLGHSLIDLENSVTKVTKACFEPALDYCVVKIPRWDLQKFRRVSKNIGSEMKSVGEVMAIGRKFEEALQKAIRMLNIGMYGLIGNKISFKELIHAVKHPTDNRIFALVDSFKQGYTVEQLSDLTKIDEWFLHKIKKVVDLAERVRKYSLSDIPNDLFVELKQHGFSDKQIAMLINEENELTIRTERKKRNILPVVKQIDTLAAEYPAVTNYLYLTYNGQENDAEFTSKGKIAVLGSGAYRIGSSVEFDWCGVSAIQTIRKMNYGTIMINCNPETVSTDYDICDHLYFEELSFERVLDILDREQPIGVLLSTGGQIPNNLALKLHNQNIRILGTSPLNIDKAEDRHKFSSLCDNIKIDQPEWSELKSEEDALKFANKIGYPVLVRPSYVLSGSAMNVAFSEKELKNYLEKATTLSEDYPVVISKFILDAKEIEIDAVAKNGGLLIWAISEHVENAGVHSGDATIVLPPQRTYLETTRKIKRIAREIAKSLNITGPFNMQFIAKDNEVKVIECNLRASRSFPFVSKVMGQNFIEIAIKAMLGEEVKINTHSSFELDHVGVKVPQFSFSRLKGADPVLGVEMASTGEVACIGSDMNDAFLKATLSVGLKVPKKDILVSISGDKNRFKLLSALKLLKKQEYNLYATDDTFKFLKENNVDCTMVYKIHEQDKKPNVMDYLLNRKFDLVICVPKIKSDDGPQDKYVLRRTSIDYNIPLITNVQFASQFIHAFVNKKVTDLEVLAWGDYLKNNK